MQAAGGGDEITLSSGPNFEYELNEGHDNAYVKKNIQGFDSAYGSNFRSQDEPIVLTVKDDFGTASYECYYHGFMGGAGNLVYDSSCPAFVEPEPARVPAITTTTTTTTRKPIVFQQDPIFTDPTVPEGYDSWEDWFDDQAAATTTTTTLEPSDTPVVTTTPEPYVPIAQMPSGPTCAPYGIVLNFDFEKQNRITPNLDRGFKNLQRELLDSNEFTAYGYLPSQAPWSMKFIRSTADLIFDDNYEIIGHRDGIPEYWGDYFVGCPNGSTGDTYLSIYGRGTGGAKNMQDIYLLEIPKDHPITDYDFRDNPNIQLPLDKTKTLRWPIPYFANNKYYLIDPRDNLRDGYYGYPRDNVSVRRDNDSQCNYYWGNVILRINDSPLNPYGQLEIPAMTTSNRRNILIERGFFSILTNFAEVMRFYINDYSCRDHYTSTYLIRLKEENKQFRRKNKMHYQIHIG